MLKKNNKTIIGIDHGYGYTKTASNIIKSGVERLIIAPPFNEDILEYNGEVYAIGQRRNEMKTEKTQDQDYYMLTLAAIAAEMKKNRVSKLTDVYLATGLPYSFMTTQAKEFQKYLRKNKNIECRYEGKKYSVQIKDVKVFPQGFPIIAKELDASNSDELTVADIGSRTIDVLTFIKGKPIYDKCFTIDRKGTLDCLELITRYYLTKFNENIDEEDIQNIFQGNDVSLPEENVKFVKEIIKIYINDVIKQLEARGVKYNVVYCGGGATILKVYNAPIDVSSKIKDDIYGNAKGYEMLAYNML